jgi:hypothetical protein
MADGPRHQSLKRKLSGEQNLSSISNTTTVRAKPDFDSGLYPKTDRPFKSVTYD